MSNPFFSTPLRERIAGKWQIPAFILAFALLVGSLLQFKPPRDRMPYDRVIRELDALVEGGLYASALDLGERLLDRARKEDRGWQDTGPVHLLVGRARYLQAEQESRRTALMGKQIIEDLDHAAREGVTLAADDYAAAARACEWMGDFESAMQHYGSAIAVADPPALDLRKRVIELRWHQVPTPRPDLHVILDGFIADAGSDPSLLRWAAERKLHLLLEDDRFDEARSLVEGLREVFEPSGEREAFEYFLCLIDYESGRFDEAETKLRALRNRLLIREETYALSGWLLGRVVLNDGSAQRPQEALSFFRDVILAKVSPRCTAASHLGMAEALAELHRWDESLEHYRSAVAALPEVEPSPMLEPDQVRSSITVAGERLSREGQFALALGFFELAHSLVDPQKIEQSSLYLRRLGDTRANLARSLTQEARGLDASEENLRRRDALHEEARRLFLGAGDAYVRMAKINALNEELSSWAAWRAADLFDEGGDRVRTIELLREFVRERPEDPLAPRAWVRLGQSLHSLGEFAEAVEAYQACNRRFPRSPDAAQSRIPLADCYMRMGPEYVEHAEKTLRGILEDDELFTPEAPEFRTALFMLGDLLNREGRYEEAITSLEEALARYPRNERAVRGLYLLADSYQFSALALKEDLKDNRLIGERERMRKEMRRRLVRAADLFGELVARYEAQGEDRLDDKSAMYLRHARLGQGDCLYELRRYGEALKTFERAAWIYKDTPSALAAYVQIINCHVFLGQMEEAKAALRRAQYLVRTIPQRAFNEAVLPESREEWQQYFDWVETSGLLKPPQLAGR